MCFVEAMWTCDGGQMQELVAGARVASSTMG